jgi:hypothetical protein
MPMGGEIYLETENVLLDDERVLPYAIKPGKYVKISNEERVLFKIRNSWNRLQTTRDI